MKKTSLLGMVILIIFSQLSLSNLLVYANSDSEEDYITMDVDNGVSIWRYNGLSKDIVIPSEIKGKPVVEIGGFAFSDKYLKSVKIPSSVTTIGFKAFANNLLEDVEIPLGIKTIGDNAFANNQLTGVDIPSSVITIGDAAFNANLLTSVEIPPSVKTISKGAFSSNQLTSVKIPSSVTTIGEEAFYRNNLSNVEIPSSVTTIGMRAFQSNQLTRVDIPSSVTTIENGAFGYNQLMSVEIPSSVKIIGTGAFSRNELNFVIFHGTPQLDSDYTGGPLSYQFKDNNFFKGWFEDPNLTIKWTESVSQPMTIYSEWNKSYYNVNFDSDGGSEVTPEEVKEGELVKTPTAPMKEEYTFAGWYKDKELSETWDFAKDVVTKNTTLYAKWMKDETSEPSYTVTFDSNGGSEITPEEVKEGELVKTPTTPMKEGDTFAGWYKDKELSEMWGFAKDVVTKNITLHAKWTKDNTLGGGSGGSGSSGGGSSNYKITFDSNGGSEVPSQTVGYNDLVKAPSTPVKEGYQFEGWYKDKELNNAWDFVNNKVTADITLYAKWTKGYIVTFDSNGGSEISSQKVPFKALVKAPSNPKKEGYLFIGWYKNEKFTKAWDFAKDVVTEDLALYARWMKESHGCDITFKDIDQNWAQDMIKEVAERCIIIGFPDGTFRPNDRIQRQHVVLMIDRALQPAPIRDAVSFSDVPKSHVNYEQITRLQRAGIVDGSNGAFRPTASITRAEMAKVIVLAFGLTPEGSSTFKDVDPSHWASEYIATLADHNIALGDENGNFRPNENLTRAEFTAIMYRALGL